MTSTPLRTLARALSLKPGVYLFRDARGHVLYVGKANSLRKRVLQYCDPARLDPAKQDMVPRIASVDTIVTSTEPEALALEATLMNEYKPPYNVRLVDDASYLYVKITSETYPTVVLTRKVLPDGAWYRGPYPNARSIRRTIKEARKFFPWCAYPNPEAQHVRACFAYHLGLCPGICIRAISLEEYQRNFEQLKKFLDGDIRDALHALRARMATLSHAQAYEAAGRTRDAIQAIEQSMIPQNVVTSRDESADILGVARRGTHAAVAVLQLRRGRILGTHTFSLLHPPDEHTSAVLRGFALQYYGSATVEASLVIVPERIDDESAIAAWLRARQGHRVVLRRARRGWKRQLLSLAKANAEEALGRSLTELGSSASVTRALADLAAALRLPEPPARIETYDVSNIQGTLATGSMIVFLKGKPAPSAYRKFKIVTHETPNDVGMMREMLTRRFARHAGIEHRASKASDNATIRTKTEARSMKHDEWPLPDLVLIDGGRAQLNVAREVLAACGIERPVAALAKREEELFLPGRRDPLLLPRSSPALYLIQRMRDEAHRFTVGYHRLLRQKRMTQSLLEEIPGVGDATRKKLVRSFGSVRGVRAAPQEDLAKVVGPALARTIRDFLSATERSSTKAMK